MQVQAQVNLTAAQLLRVIPGAQTHIARRLRPPVHPSLVSRVAAGRKRSARVERAIRKFLLKQYGPLLSTANAMESIGRSEGNHE